MSDMIIFSQGTATVVVPAGERIAVQSLSSALMFQQVGFPQMPNSQTLLATVENGTYTSPVFTNGATLVIQANASDVYYTVGVAPVINNNNGSWQLQPSPANIADSASMIMLASDVMSGIITATPTAARNVQFPLGTNLELATDWAIDESIDFTIITLAAFALTVTVNTGVTIVGSPATAATAGSTARFRLRKTALNTFVAYRVA
jgi:hypothetical protein